MFQLTLVKAQVTPNYLQSTSKHVLNCGDVIEYGTTVNIDTLVLSCSQTLLLQDNSVLNVKKVIWFDDPSVARGDELVRLMYGDIGFRDTIAGVKIDTLYREDDYGYAYMDYRPSTDYNPVVNFLECRPTGIFGDLNVDINYSELCPDVILDDEQFVVTPENELNLDCTIWDMKGAQLYQGKFSGIFGGDCGVRCLKELFWNQVLLIEFRYQDGNDKLMRIRAKRIYVR